MADFSAWQYRREIEVSASNVDATLTDVPSLLEFSNDSDLMKARADGYDVRFALTDDTELNYQRLLWSRSTDVEAKFWIQIPTLDSTSGASLVMYYGNAAASDGSSAADAFSASGLECAIQMDGTSSPEPDITGNGHNAVITQGTQSAAGVIAASREATAVGDRMLVAENASMDGQDEVTVDCWIWFNDLDGFYADPVCWAKQDYSSFGVRLYGGSDRFQFNVGSTALTHTATIVEDTWYHVAARFKRNDASGLQIYVNGVAATAVSTVGDAATPSNVYDYSLLSRYWNSRGMDGRMEDWRYWVTADPCGDAAAYAQWTYNNVTSADNEMTVGSELSNGGVSQIIGGGILSC